MAQLFAIPFSELDKLLYLFALNGLGAISGKISLLVKATDSTAYSNIRIYFHTTKFFGIFLSEFFVMIFTTFFLTTKIRKIFHTTKFICNYFQIIFLIFRTPFSILLRYAFSSYPPNKNALFFHRIFLSDLFAYVKKMLYLCKLKNHNVG